MRCFGDGFGARFGDILERPAMVRWGASEWTVASGTRPKKFPTATVHFGGPRWTVASATRRDHSGGQFGGHFGIMSELILEVTLETCWSDPM